MSNSDVRRLLRKGKLSGKEAALLIIRHEWEDETSGQGFLSEIEIETIKGNIRAGQHTAFNDYMRLFDMARHAGQDTEHLALRVSAACGDLIPIVLAYAEERLLRTFRASLPHVVTAKEYEERRLAQREDKLLYPVCLGYVLSWYMPQDELASERLLQEYKTYERDVPEDEQEYYEGIFDYVLGEGKEPELARPWLEWLLEMLRGGRLNPVHYTEEASEQAHSYFPSNSDYASIYQEQGERPEARDTDALIEVIENYLAGELEPVKLDDRLWDTFVAGPEFYEAGLAKYQEYIDNYDPRLPDWPIMAILQDEHSPESVLFINRETGHYKREEEDRHYALVTQFKAIQDRYSEIEGGLEGFLLDMMRLLAERLRELRTFELGLQAVSEVLGIAFLELEAIALNTQLAYSKVKSLNAFIHLATMAVTIDRGPLLLIEQIDLSNLEPDERVVELLNNRMGKFLSNDWAKRPLEAHELQEEEIVNGPA